MNWIIKKNNENEEQFNLLVPFSRCPHCQQKIRAWENIPVLSYVFLKGRSSSRQSSISIYYPAIELLTSKKGMGYCDFKLLEMLGGVWVGSKMLPLTLIFSLFCGALISINISIFGGQDYKQAMPLHPYLAIAGWLSLIWREQISSSYNNWFQIPCNDLFMWGLQVASEAGKVVPVSFFPNSECLSSTLTSLPVKLFNQIMRLCKRLLRHSDQR